MKRYEKVAAVLMVCGFALALYLAMRSDAGTITEGALWTWAFIAAALQLTAMGIVKKGGEKMTYREMLQRDHPRKCGSRFIGGCQGCPGDYYPGAPTEDENGCFYNGTDDEYQCERCWDRTSAKKDPTE